MVCEVANAVRLECEALCCKKQPSLLRTKDRSSLEKFSWTHLINEFSQRIPVLMSMVLAAADSMWRRKSGNTMQSKCVPPVCMALAMLFKTRSKHMSSVQAVVSILLKAGHVTSEVRITIVVLLMCSRVHIS